MKNKSIIISGLICITILESIALLKGINGTLLTMVIGAILLTVGVAVPTPKVMQ